jgi:hypothetical protein
MLKEEYYLRLAIRTDIHLRLIYGPFVPGSAARDLKHDNEKLGMRTCWQCLKAYRSKSRVSNGRRLTVGRGNFYCSRGCYVEDRAADNALYRLRRQIEGLDPDESFRWPDEDEFTLALLDIEPREWVTT